MTTGSAPQIDFIRIGQNDAALLLAWIERYYTYDHIEYHAKSIESAIPLLLQDDRKGCAYFIQQNDQTVGYFILTYAFDLEFGGLHGMLTDFFLDEQHRRGGIGSWAFQFIESVCQAKNFSTLLLQVEIDNAPAKTFYQKSGLQTLTRNLCVKKIEGKNS